MTEPKIPGDVMTAAASVIEQHRATEGAALQRLDAMLTFIARAILAERERCHDQDTAPMIQEAWAALQLIRETIETVGPIGALLNDERIGGLMREAEVLSEAIVAMAIPDGWEPIETAPKDGTIIHVWAEDYRWPETVKWEEYDAELKEETGEDGYWTFAEALLADATDSPGADEWTHWRPLPAAPLPKQGDGE